MPNLTPGARSDKPVILFMGSPAVAVHALRALVESENYEIACVITQPDRPAGRGHELSAPPVKLLAHQLELRLFQPNSLKGIHLSDSGNSLCGSEELAPLLDFVNALPRLDAIVVVAFGQIIPMPFLNRARCGGVNVHFSLLPRWRGAAPIQHAILNGDLETGVCIMQLEAGLDTGPVYSTTPVQIDDVDNWGTLEQKLSECGTSALLSALPQIVEGRLSAIPQAAEGASYAPKWTNVDRQIHWTHPARSLWCRIRACAPVLGARAQWRGQLFKIYSAKAVKNQNYPSQQPGAIVECNKAELVVEAGKDANGQATFLSLLEVQFPGKKRLPIAEILKSSTFSVGDRFD